MEEFVKEDNSRIISQMPHVNRIPGKFPFTGFPYGSCPTDPHPETVRKKRW